LISVVAVAAWGQAPKTQATARVETVALELSPPERYQIPLALQPARSVAVIAPADGIVRSLPVPVGAMVRENQDIVQLDRLEATAHLKIAQANLKEAQASVTGQEGSHELAITKARVDAAQARVELAQMELDRCTLRAPFPGRMMSYAVSPGQYVAKGATVADLADISSLRVFIPVDRTAVKDGGNLEILVEGKPMTGKIQAILPLPDSYAVLRELATPWAAAWVTIPNPDSKAALESGERVGNSVLPTSPITVVPNRAIQEGGDSRDSIVQVIRGEYVTAVPVTVLGTVGPERVQVSGPFRPSDAAIVESSVPLLAGTLIRFGAKSDAPVEGVAPKPGAPGVVADIVPPTGGAATRVAGTGSSRVQPIGAPDSNVPKSSRSGAATKGTTKSTNTKGTSKSATPPQTGGTGTVPF
jgi:multidrug efflux pump subunit AcrA (membrane-fusion protein)